MKLIKTNFNAAFVFCLVFCLMGMGCSSQKQDPAQSVSTPSHTLPLSENGNLKIENFDCTGFELKEETLDPQTFRKLVFCLGRNGSLDPYLKLLARISDSGLQALLDVVNTDLVLNKKRMRDLDVSIDQLRSNENLRAEWLRLAGFAATPDLITGAARFTKKIAIDPEKKHVRPEYLKTIEVLAKELSQPASTPYSGSVFGLKSNRDAWQENLFSILDYLSVQAASENTKRMSEGLKLPIQGSSLETLSKQGFRFFQSKSKNTTPYLTLMLWGFADGSLFHGLDAYLKAKTPEEYWNQLLNLNHLFGYFSRPENEKTLEQITRLYQGMNAPLSCLDGNLEIPNINLYVMNSWLSEDPKTAPVRVGRNNLLELKLSDAVCKYPADLEPMVSLMSSLAKNEPSELVTTAEFISALGVAGKSKTLKESSRDLKGVWGGSERYLRLLNDYMSDRSEDRFIETLTASMRELTREDREFWSRAFYFLDTQDTQKLSRFLMTFLKSRKDLGVEPSFWEKHSKTTTKNEVADQSVLQVWLELFQNTDSDGFFEMIKSFAALVGVNDDQNSVSIPQAVQALRVMVGFNNSNPLVEMILSRLKNASNNEPFIRALLEVAALPEMQEALDFTNKLSKNGELFEIAHGVMDLMRGTWNGNGNGKNIKNLGNPPVLSQSYLPFQSKPIKLNEWIEKIAQKKLPKRKSKDFVAVSSARNIQACQDLRYDVDLDQTSSPVWASQMQSFAQCLNSSSRYDALEEFVRFGVENQIQGKPALAFLTNLGKKIVSADNPSERKILFSEAAHWVKSETVAKLPELSQYFFEKTYPTGFGERLSPIQAAFQAMDALYNEKSTLTQFNQKIASWVEDYRLPLAVALFFDNKKLADSLNWPLKRFQAPLSPETLKDLKEKTAQYEFDNDGTVAGIQSLVEEKVSSYWNQIFTWQQKDQFGSADGFKRAFRPMLDELANPKREVLENALTFFLKMHTNPYDPAWLDGWFQRLSSHIEAIPYYYPGHFPHSEKPTVRLVSQLDLLELIVLDADFTLRELGQGAGSIDVFGKKIGEDPDENFALRYLTGLAQAGDNLTGWVDHLHEDMNFYYDFMFPDMPTPRSGVGGIPQQIKNAANAEKIKIIKPELRRRIFNLKQVAHVVRDLNYKRDSYGRNDLSILRDLFAAVHGATKAEYKYVHRKDVNSLSFIVELVRFGLLRNISSSMWFVDRNGTSRFVDTKPVLNLLTKTATVLRNGKWVLNPETVEIFDYLLRNDSILGWAGSKGGKLTFDERYRFVGAVVDHVYNWMKLDEQKNSETIVGRVLLEMARFSDLVVEKNESSPFYKNSFVENLIHLVKPFLATASGNRLVLNKMDLLRDSMTTKSTALFFEMLSESADNELYSKEKGYTEKQAFEAMATYLGTIVQDLSSKPDLILQLFTTLYLEDLDHRFESFENVIEKLSQDPAYQRVLTRSTKSLGESTVRFLVKSPASSILRKNLAQSIRNQDWLAFLQFVSQNTKSNDLLYQKVRFLGSPELIRDFSDYILKVQRSISLVPTK